MEQVFQNFLDAADELDELSLEGFFGEDIKLIKDEEYNDFKYDVWSIF